MANVITDHQQVVACDEINQMLSEVQMLNIAITDRSSFSFPISRKQSIVLDAAYTDKLIALLKQQRVKRIKEIQAKANKFHIRLDKSDLEVISDEALKAHKKAEDSAAVPEDDSDADLSLFPEEND